MRLTGLSERERDELDGDDCCMSCGGRPSIYWRCGTGRAIELCDSCAADVLPGMLADLVRHGATRDDAEHVWERAAGRFWRALCGSGRVLRAGR